MKIWLDNNPKKRKTNYNRFIANWLNNVIPEKTGSDILDDILKSNK